MTTTQTTPAIFSNPALFSGNLRVIMQGDDPWFVAKDVCLALGFNVKSNGDVNVTNATSRLLPDEIITARVSDGRGAAAKLVSESGLYKLIMRSDKPVAKAFQDWVTREVLPSIRKTGGYIAATPDESPEVILARAVLVAQDTIERMKAQAAALEAEVKELAPKAQTYDAVVAQRMMKVHDFARSHRRRPLLLLAPPCVRGAGHRLADAVHEDQG